MYGLKTQNLNAPVYAFSDSMGAVRLLLKVCGHLQDIYKLGVGITGDAHKLQRDFGVNCNGLVCLSEEASLRLTKEQMPETRGLAGRPNRHMS